LKCKLIINGIHNIMKNNISNVTGYLVTVIVLIYSIKIGYAEFMILDASNYYSKAVEFLFSNRAHDAQDMMKAAIQLTPENAYYWSLYGLSIERVNGNEFQLDDAGATHRIFPQMDEVQEAYEKARQLNPKDDCFEHNLAWLEFMKGNTARAMEHIAKAQANDGRNAINYISAGLFLESGHGNYERVAREYAHALWLEPSIMDSELFGKLSERDPGMMRQALEIALHHLEGLQKEDRNPIIAARLGKLYLHNGDMEHSRDNLHFAAECLPNLSRPWLSLSRIEYQTGNLARADEYLARARILDPNDPNYQWEACLQRVEQSQDRVAEAICNRAASSANNIWSGHSAKAGRVYKVKQSIADDIIPKGLLRSIAPMHLSSIRHAFGN
jgi:tetratricopeptide (TPR) repeat protein